MFSERPEGPLRPANKIGISLVGMAAVVLLALSLVIYDATDGLTMGSLGDLCPPDANVLTKIRQADVPVCGDEVAYHCSRSLIVKVRWDFGCDAYCVHSVTFRTGSIEIEKVEPLLGQFAALKRINAPGISPAERDRIAALFPQVAVSSNRTSFAGQASSWLWGGTGRQGC